MSRLWGPAAILLAAAGGAVSTRYPLLSLAAVVGIIGVVAVSRNRAAATAALLPLCLLPYAIALGGLLLGPSDALLVVVVGILLLDWAVHRETGPLLGPLAVPAVAFVGWTAGSVIWAADPRAVMVEAAQRAAFVLGGMAVVRAMPVDGRAVRRSLIALIAGSALLGAATVVTGAVQGRWLHVYALGMHKNWLGFVLSFGLVALVALALDALRRPSGIWLAAASLPLTTGLLMSGSRGGWIGALAGTAVIVVLERPLFGWPTLSAAATVIVLLFVAVPGLTTERVDVSTPDTSAGIRLRTWSSGVEAIRERPILGHGAGNFRAVIKDRGSQVDPNNLTLLAWAETGILGLLFLAALFAGAFRLALANAPRLSGTTSMANAAGAGIVMAALAHAQFDMFWTRGVALATFMGMGLVLWSHRLAAEQPEQPYPAGLVTAS